MELLSIASAYYSFPALRGRFQHFPAFAFGANLDI